MVQKLPGLPGLNSVMAPPMWRCFFRVSVDLCIWLGFPFLLCICPRVFATLYGLCFFTRFMRSSLLMRLRVLRSERIVVEPWCCWEFATMHVLFLGQPLSCFGECPSCDMFDVLVCSVHLVLFQCFQETRQTSEHCVGDQ